jgi:hypothetical protein
METKKLKRTSEPWQHGVLRTLSYGTRVALASKAAAEGFGFEDIEVKLGLHREIARAIVFARKDT